MKSNSNERPEILMDLGNGHYHYNYNIEEVERDNELGKPQKSFDYETVEIWGIPDYPKCVKAVIAEKYDYSQEIALINKYNAFALEIDEDTAARDEYMSYLQFVKGVKQMVKSDLNIV
ncbi:MAG: hypothetical protein AB9922_07505 [Bacteroidales bacterium]